MNTPSSLSVNNNENMPSNDILVALQILPKLPQQQTINDIIESTENQVKLNIPKAPVFSFDLVLDSNSQKEEYNEYLFETIPKLAMDQLLQGHNTSVLFYDALAANNRFDTRIILEFAHLFELEDHEIYVKFIEYNGQHTEDLISAGKSNHHKFEYRIDTIDLALKYYIFGSEQHTNGTSSIYSIILKNQLKTTQFNLIDLSGCPHETLMQFSNYCSNRNTTMPFTQLIDKSASCVFIGCISPLDSVLQLQQTLSYTSTIFEQLNHKNTEDSIESKSPLTPIRQEDPEYLKSVIIKLSNEVNILRSNSLASSAQSSKHGSMFSSLSHSTSATLPDIAEDEKEHAVADLYRQIEELENQMTVTKERNEHVEHELSTMRNTNMELWDLSDKQTSMIDALELKLDQVQDKKVNDNIDIDDIKRDMQELGIERHEIEGNLQVIGSLVLKQDNETTKALEELMIMRQQFKQQRNSTYNSSSDSASLIRQRTRALENRVEELDNYIEKDHVHQNNQEETEKWKHTSFLQSAKASALEKKLITLEDELNVYRKTISEGDVSGLVANLEKHIMQLEREKMVLEDDFETSYEAAINETEKVTQLANQQAHQIQQLEAALAETHQQFSDNQSMKQAFDALQKKYALLERTNQELTALKQQPPRQSIDRQSTTSIASVYKKRRTANRKSLEDKPQLMSWIQDKLDTASTVDVLQKVSNLADENMQLALWVDDLETQLMSQHHHLSQQVKTLECDVMNLTVLNNQLERQIEVPLRLSRSSVAMLRSRRDETSPSVHSDNSKYRSSTPNVPPPTEPPSQPLPPTPFVTEQYDNQLKSFKLQIEVAENETRANQTLIQKLETQIDAAESKQQEMQDQYTNIQKDLEFERRQTQKAEKAHAILEKRLQDVMNNKKNKFLCF